MFRWFGRFWVLVVVGLAIAAGLGSWAAAAGHATLADSDHRKVVVAESAALAVYLTPPTGDAALSVLDVATGSVTISPSSFGGSAELFDVDSGGQFALVQAAVGVSPDSVLNLVNLVNGDIDIVIGAPAANALARLTPVAAVPAVLTVQTNAALVAGDTNGLFDWYRVEVADPEPEELVGDPATLIPVPAGDQIRGAVPFLGGSRVLILGRDRAYTWDASTFGALPLQLFAAYPITAGGEGPGPVFVPDFGDVDVSESGQFVSFGPYVLDRDPDSDGDFDAISSIDTFAVVDGFDAQTLTLTADSSYVAALYNGPDNIVGCSQEDGGGGEPGQGPAGAHAAVYDLGTGAAVATEQISGFGFDPQCDSIIATAAVTADGTTLVAGTFDQLDPADTDQLADIYTFDLAPVASPYAAQVLADGPVAYWRLGEPAGTVLVDELGGHPGQVIADVEFGVTGLVDDPSNTALRVGPPTVPNAAVHFASGQGPGTLLPADELTVEYWIDEITDLASGTTIEAGTTSDAFVLGWNISVNDDSGLLQAIVPESEFGLAAVSWDPPPSGGGPYHIVVTRDLAELRLYINGVVVDSAPTSGAPIFYDFTGPGQLRLGPANGQTIDELAIYDTALTPTQIAAHYSLGVDSTGGGGGEPTLVAELTNREVGYAVVDHFVRLGFDLATPEGAMVDADVVLDVTAGPNTGSTVTCISFGLFLFSTDCSTGSDGRLRAVYLAAEQGLPSGVTDTVVAFADLDGDGVRDQDEPQSTLDVVIAEPVNYVSVGDSYTSGENGAQHLSINGIDLEYLNINPADQVCRRWISAYALRLSLPGFGGQTLESDPGASVEQRACTGALTLNIFDAEPEPATERPSRADIDQLEQRQAVSLAAAQVVDGVDLIVLTIGGNDMRFSDLIRACFETDGCESDQAIADQFVTDLGNTGTRTAAVIGELRSIAPDTPIFVLGYPFLTPDEYSDCSQLNPKRDLLKGRELDREDQVWVRERQNEFNAAQQSFVEAAGVHYVPLYDTGLKTSFAGHEVCDDSAEDWVFGLQFEGLRAESGRAFHPTYAGQGGYATILEEYIVDRIESGAALNGAGIPLNPGPGVALSAAAVSLPVPSPGADAIYTEIVATRDVGETCDATSFTPGQTAVLSVSGFAPGSIVEFDAVGGDYLGPATAVADSGGSVTVTATAGAATEPDAFYYVASGATSGGREVLGASVVLEVSPNAPLCPASDGASTTLDSSITVDVLANDAGPVSLDPASVVLDSGGPAGIFVADPATGQVTYTPALGFVGIAQSSYTVCDSLDRCRSAVVTVDVTALCTITGTDGDDIITGTEGADVICAGSGNDLISGLGGDDVIIAGAGNDYIDAGAGADTIYGGAGADVIAGGPGADLVVTGTGADEVDGTDPADDILSDAEDTVFTTAGAVDTAAPQVSIVSPADGAVFVQGQAIPAQYWCTDSGSGVASCVGPVASGAVIDTATLGSHSFMVTAVDVAGNTTAASVTYSVTAGPSAPVAADDADMVEAADTISIDVLGNDTDVDDDIDEATLRIVTPAASGLASVVDDGDGPEINYQAPTGSGTDMLTYEICDDTGLCDTATVTVTVIATSDCTITGTAGDDVLIGTSGDDVICGFGGADIIDGGAGDDVILGGRGADVIRGQGGDDIIVGGRGADELRGGAGDDVLRGRRGADLMFGGAGADELRGGKGNDTIEGGSGDDVLFAGKGSDVLRGQGGDDELRGRRGADELRGGAGADVILGGRGPDVLRGGSGDDVLRGRRGADDIRGGVGDDLLFGGRGADVLDGGPGIDSLVGGPGADVCTNGEVTVGCEL